VICEESICYFCQQGQRKCELSLLSEPPTFIS